MAIESIFEIGLRDAILEKSKMNYSKLRFTIILGELLNWEMAAFGLFSCVTTKLRYKKFR